MMAKTHFAFGFLAGLLLLPVVAPKDVILFFAIVLIGALLPDIDTTNSKLGRRIPVIPRLISLVSKHRGIFHSIWIALAASLTLGYLTYPVHGIALFIGYMSHLFSDGLTLEGINFIHPIGKLHMSGFIETGKTGELVLFLGLVGVIVLMVV